MTNSERKIIHKYLSQIEGVESHSEGDDPNRYVVVDKSIIRIEFIAWQKLVLF